MPLLDDPEPPEADLGKANCRTSGKIYNSGLEPENVKPVRKKRGGLSGNAIAKRPTQRVACKGPDIRNPFVNPDPPIKIKAGKPTNRDMKENVTKPDCGTVYVLSSIIRRWG